MITKREESVFGRPALVGVFVVIVGVSYSLLLAPILLHWRGWWLNAEAFSPVYAGRWVWNGAYAYLYEADSAWIAGPLLPVVVAPVAGVQDLFALTDNLRFGLPHPTLWLVLMPYGLSFSIPLLMSVRSLARVLVTDSRALIWLQWGTVALVLTSTAIVFSHYEDVLALTFLLLATRDALTRREGVRGAIFAGVAVAFKQWSVLALPILFVSVPRRRTRWAVVALGIPAVLMGIPLAVDWPDASRALLSGRAFPMKGHPALWVGDTHQVIVGTGFRTLAVVFALVIAWVIRRRPDARTVLAALGLAFLVRLAFEPVVFGYYPCPALLFLAFHELATTERIRRTVTIGVLMQGLFPFHFVPAVWWTIELGLSAILVMPAARDLLGRIRPRDASTMTAIDTTATGARYETTTSAG
jgi:hypothetical protein